MSQGILRPETSMLASGLQEIYECLRNNDAKFVPGGPLGFQIEVKGFVSLCSATQVIRVLQALLQEKISVPLVWKGFPVGIGCLPRDARVEISFQYCVERGATHLPFAFIIYGPETGASFKDFRVLITPLKK